MLEGEPPDQKPQEVLMRVRLLQAKVPRVLAQAIARSNLVSRPQFRAPAFLSTLSKFRSETIV